MTLPDGTEVARYAFMGAEGRYEDYVYLRLLEREWKRPIADDEQASATGLPSPRAVMALVFWTYFETRIDRLLRQAMRDLPEKVMEELLARHSSIGSRLDRLYRILFSTTYWHDLESVGYHHVSAFLKDLHRRRNRFIHGDPSALDDDLISQIVVNLKLEHESWISVFNLRAARSQVNHTR
jgi:hypothetical protein